MIISAESLLNRKDLTTEWITLLDFMTLLNSDLDNNARHGSANRPGVIGGFLARDGFYSRVLVVDGYSSDL